MTPTIFAALLAALAQSDHPDIRRGLRMCDAACRAELEAQLTARDPRLDRLEALVERMIEERKR